MAAPNRDSSFDQDGHNTKKQSTRSTYFDNDHSILSGIDDNGSSDDDAMINLSGESHNEEQLITKSASQGKNKQIAITTTADNDNVARSVSGSASPSTDFMSLTQNTSQRVNRRSLSNEKDQEHLYEDNQHDPSDTRVGPYAHPDLYPVSSISTVTNVSDRSFNTNHVNGLRKSPSPTSQTPANHQYLQHQQQLQQKPNQGHFDPLAFSDPTFVNSFSPQLTPNSPGSPPRVIPSSTTLPFLGAGQRPSTANDKEKTPPLLLLTPGEPQDPQLFPVPDNSETRQGRNTYSQNVSINKDSHFHNNAPDLIPNSDNSKIKTSNNVKDGFLNPPFHPQASSTTANLLDISFEEEDLEQQLRTGEDEPKSEMNSDYKRSLFPLEDKDEDADTGDHFINNAPRPIALSPGSPTATPFPDNQQFRNVIDGFVNNMTSEGAGNPINPNNTTIDDDVSSSSPSNQARNANNDLDSSTSSMTNTFTSSSCSSSSYAPVFQNNNNNSNTTGGFSISNILSVGRKSQSARSKSEPASYITHVQNRNQHATAAGTQRPGKNNSGRPHAQHGVSPGGGPLRREMISPTMFGHYSGEYGEQQQQNQGFTDSLFPQTTPSSYATAGAGDEVGDESTDRCPSSVSSSTAAMYRDHCHSRRGARTVDRVARRQLSAVVILCLLFMTGEAIGGALSNSLALFTDVLHLGSDLISFIISLLALYLSTKPASKTMSFGYHRAEVLGALFSVFLIWLVSGVLCYIAVERIMKEHYKDVKPDEMLITASLGVVFNIIMGFVLHSEMCCKGAHSHTSFGHGHSHGHSHSGHTANGGTNSSVEYQPLENSRNPSNRRRQLPEDAEYAPDENTEETRKILDSTSSSIGMEDDSCAEEDHESHGPTKHKNLNVRAAFIHVLGDIIQSLGVLVAACIIKFQPDERYRLADPICTFIFSIIVLVTTISVLRDTIRVMMEGVPRDLCFETLKRELLSIPGVVMVHSLHIWALTLDRNAISVHLAIDDPSLHHKVLGTATSLVQNKHQFYFSTIQVEMFHREVMSSCHQCQENV